MQAPLAFGRKHKIACRPYPGSAFQERANKHFRNQGPGSTSARKSVWSVPEAKAQAAYSHASRTAMFSSISLGEDHGWQHPSDGRELLICGAESVAVLVRRRCSGEEGKGKGRGRGLGEVLRVMSTERGFQS